jgi:hypothetical protein
MATEAFKQQAKKRKMNPNSVKNLKQNRDADSKKLKDATLEELADRLDMEAVMQVIAPLSEIFKPEEQKRFMAYFKLYIQEFSLSDSHLTISDLDDVATLCKNKILEDRLLAASRKEPAGIAEYMPAIDKLKKENKSLKDQLAATRTQRVDPRSGKEITVLDILYEYEQRSRESLDDKLKQYEEEEQEIEGLFSSSIDKMIT